jgi:hypothetical protein
MMTKQRLCPRWFWSHNHGISIQGSWAEISYLTWSIIEAAAILAIISPAFLFYIQNAPTISYGVVAFAVTLLLLFTSAAVIEYMGKQNPAFGAD